MLANFAPESVGVVHVIDMGEFVDDNIVAERFRYLH
jgi:hypothetical protein